MHNKFLPVRKLNARALHDWMFNHCWDGDPTGQCCNTARFVELVFGWPAIMGRYHAWNESPHSQHVLDLTVAQFGYEHGSQLVHKNTEFDLGYTYATEPQKRLKLKTSAIAWARQLQQHILDGVISGTQFGISKCKLLERLAHICK